MKLTKLKNALSAIQPVKSACLYAKNDALKRLGERLNLCESIRDRINKEIQPDPPQLVNKGDVIAPGYSKELDELRSIRDHGKQYLMEIQNREIEQTGISSLKIGFNNVFGYYITLSEIGDGSSYVQLDAPTGSYPYTKPLRYIHVSGSLSGASTQNMLVITPVRKATYEQEFVDSKKMIISVEV